jgi:hypothetical protein
MAGHGSQFSRKKEAAIVALLTARNLEEAARMAGVSVATILRWKKRPEFEAAYRQARRDAYNQSFARLQQASSPAVSTLLKIMLDPKAPVSSRVRAAVSVMVLSSKAVQIEDIDVRVTELERAMEISNSQKARLP